MGPCADVRVTCEIITRDGRVFHGENTVGNPQPACPRVGADYRRGDFRLCHAVCRAGPHAEMRAIYAARAAGADLRGAKARVVFHRARPGWVCDSCRNEMSAEGFGEIVLEAAA